jgi:outer membrane PBP1 activator LpoA protein
VRPSAGTLAALTLAIVLAACGGGGGSNATAERPTLPRSVAEDLAAQSDQIADALERGDVCGAAHLADELKDAVDAAVAGGRIPAAFQDEVERTATELQNGVNCDEDEQQDEDKGKKNDHADTTTDETTTLGTTLSTTTEGG